MPLVRTTMRLASIRQTAGVSDIKLTGRPDDAVAYTWYGGAPRARLEVGEVMSIVWLAAVTAKLRSTLGAGECVESPPCAARMEHVPTARSVAVPAVTTHTLEVSEEKATGNPADAVALSKKGMVPKTRLPGGAKVIV